MEQCLAFFFVLFDGRPCGMVCPVHACWGGRWSDSPSSFRSCATLCRHKVDAMIYCCVLVVLLFSSFWRGVEQPDFRLSLLRRLHCSSVSTSLGEAARSCWTLCMGGFFAGCFGCLPKTVMSHAAFFPPQTRTKTLVSTCSDCQSDSPHFDSKTRCDRNIPCLRYFSDFVSFSAIDYTVLTRRFATLC